MNAKELKKLRTRLSALAVFRSLLSDRTMSLLCDYLDLAAKSDELGNCQNSLSDAVSGYSAFAAELYASENGDLAAHVRSLCEESENVYMKLVGVGKNPPEFMKAALENELGVLQEVSQLTREDLTECLGEGICGIALPEFLSGGADIAESFNYRVKNIGKYGYGMYAKHRMFFLDSENRISPVKNPDRTTLSDLVDYERERGIIMDNTKALLEGKPAANALLTGDAGTGKSSTIKAIVNELYTEGLRIIEVRKDQLRYIPALLDELAENPLKFILFIDDLSFARDDDNYSALKAVLEGSVSAKSGNVVIYATSNRRHIVKENFSDRDGDEIHRNDTIQELTSLSERFGLHVTFNKPDKKTYLHIVRRLAEENGITADEALDLEAERFALEMGGRSARAAKQLIDRMIVIGQG
ncbi:MAG: ATP-binding protein [Eubacteriales bacterium]